MNRILQSKRIEKVWFALVFLFMLVCNLLTLRFVDDYRYVFSFATDERLKRVLDIFPSLVSHTRIMNGRLVAHFFVHLFDILPMWVFDVVNSAMFTWLIVLITKIARGENKRNNLIAVAVFCGIWLFEPVFGQVNLWLAGSCNYLWSAVFGFCFLMPFLRMYLFDQTESSRIRQAGILLLAFCAGAYSESGSAAFILMAMLLLGLRLLEKKKLPPYLLAAAPAQWENKAAEASFASLYENILRSITMYESFGILAVAYVVMLVFCIAGHCNQKRILLSLVLILGSLAANFILVFANWYHERSAMSAFILLLTANAVLAQELFQAGQYRAHILAAVLVMMLAMPGQGMRGFIDIYYTYVAMESNEAYIVSCAEAGMGDLEVPGIHASTKYCALYGLRYLASDSADTWPNDSMSRYYGVDSMIAVD